MVIKVQFLLTILSGSLFTADLFPIWQRKFPTLNQCFYQLNRGRALEALYLNIV